MKTYGVNWFRVWIGCLTLVGPVSAWLDLFLFSHWHSPPDSHELAVGQAVCQPFLWTFLYYTGYEKTLADPQAFERLRQRLQRNKGGRNRRYRWPIVWVIVFAVSGTASTIFRLIFNQPSWLHVAGYSLLVPCSCLVFFWLTDSATQKGQLAQLLKGSQQEAP